MNIEMNKNGEVTIPRVKARNYRLTIYADDIFGDFVLDDIAMIATKETNIRAEWSAESTGTELFRIGTPDKSSGEYRHGYAQSPDHPSTHRRISSLLGSIRLFRRVPTRRNVQSRSG